MGTGLAAGFTGGKYAGFIVLVVVGVRITAITFWGC